MKLKLKEDQNTFWVWVDIETKYDETLGMNKSKERSMFVAEYFLS